MSMAGTRPRRRSKVVRVTPRNAMRTKVRNLIVEAKEIDPKEGNLLDVIVRSLGLKGTTAQKNDIANALIYLRGRGEICIDKHPTYARSSINGEPLLGAVRYVPANERGAVVSTSAGATDMDTAVPSEQPIPLPGPPSRKQHDDAPADSFDLTRASLDAYLTFVISEVRKHVDGDGLLHGGFTAILTAAPLSLTRDPAAKIRDYLQLLSYWKPVKTGRRPIAKIDMERTQVTAEEAEILILGYRDKKSKPGTARAVAPVVSVTPDMPTNEHTAMTLQGNSLPPAPTSDERTMAEILMLSERIAADRDLAQRQLAERTDEVADLNQALQTAHDENRSVLFALEQKKAELATALRTISDLNGRLASVPSSHDAVLKRLRDLGGTS
jgi:hypothetical protein